MGDPVAWDNAANWISAAPSVISDKAIFGNLGSTGLADLGAANRTCGGFFFYSPVNTSITSNGVGKTIASSSGGGECYITMAGGSHVIDANLNGNGNLRIKGTGELTLSKEVWAATFSIGKTGGSGAYTGTVILSGEVHGRGLEFGDLSYGSLSPFTLVVAGNITNTYSTSNFLSGITVSTTAGSHLVKDTYNGSAISNVTFDGPGDLLFSNALIDTAAIPAVATWTTNGTGKVICQKLTSWDVVWPGNGTNIGLVKAGPGMLEVQGSATYSGPTTVNAGSLIVTKPASLPGYLSAKVLVASGATLAVRGGGVIGVDEQWLSSDIDGLLATNSFASGASLGIEVNAGNTFNYENDIGSNEIAKGLVKLGAGSLTLAGSNSYTATTAVTAGTLLVNGTNSGSGALNVSAGAALGGTGTIGGTTTIANNGKLAFTLSTLAASHDSLDISSTLAFSGASVLDITASGSLPAAGLYTLVTAADGISGSPPATVHLPSGWAATVSISANTKSLLLNLTSVDAAIGYAEWADQYAGGATAPANGDSNNDGVQNGIAYFMGANGLTTNPGVVGGKVRWKKAVGNAYAVKVSSNLQDWQNAPDGSVTEETTGSDTYVVFALPSTPATLFGRLEVTIP